MSFSNCRSSSCHSRPFIDTKIVATTPYATLSFCFCCGQVFPSVCRAQCSKQINNSNLPLFNAGGAPSVCGQTALQQSHKQPRMYFHAKAYLNLIMTACSTVVVMEPQWAILENKVLCRVLLDTVVDAFAVVALRSQPSLCCRWLVIRWVLFACADCSLLILDIVVPSLDTKK